jgi:malate/lactate dehydrogenase
MRFLERIKNAGYEILKRKGSPTPLAGSEFKLSKPSCTDKSASLLLVLVNDFYGIRDVCLSSTLCRERKGR